MTPASTGARVAARTMALPPREQEPEKMLAIEVHELRKRYGEVDAVSGVDIAVAQGEVFCLLGPNGAGKTTIAEILEGYRERSGDRKSVV